MVVLLSQSTAPTERRRSAQRRSSAVAAPRMAYRPPSAPAIAALVRPALCASELARRGKGATPAAHAPALASPPASNPAPSPGGARRGGPERAGAAQRGRRGVTRALPGRAGVVLAVAGAAPPAAHSPHRPRPRHPHLRAPQAALRLLEGMRACELEPSTRAYNVAMRACVKGGNWAAALDTFDKLPEPDVVRSRRCTPSPHSTAAPGASRAPTPAPPRPRRSPTAPRSTRARAGGGGRRLSRCSAGCATGARGRSRTRSC